MSNDGGKRVREAFARDEETVMAASYRLDCIALAYGDAWIDKDWPKLSQLARDLKLAARELALASRGMPGAGNPKGAKP